MRKFDIAEVKIGEVVTIPPDPSTKSIQVSIPSIPALTEAINALQSVSEQYAAINKPGLSHEFYIYCNILRKAEEQIKRYRKRCERAYGVADNARRCA